MVFKQCKYNLRIAAVSITYFFCSLSIFSQNWTPLFLDMDDNGINRIYTDTVDDYLYMTGLLYTINGQPYRGIARWNGTQWDSLGHGVDALMYPGLPWCQNTFKIIRYNGEIYAGGAFYSLGDTWSPRIGKWNGSTWDSLPVPSFSITGGAVIALSVIGNELYVGGNFDSVANQPCQSIAIWNGSSWNPLGMPPIFPFGAAVGSICEYNNEVYVGGNFDSDTSRAIIRWDGTNWKSVGGGLRGLSSNIWDMEVFQGELYICGFFSKADGNAGTGIQKWDGFQWTEVGGGLLYNSSTPSVRDLAIHAGKLYACGYFNTAGGVATSNIAVWDGSVWCSLGSIFDNVLGSITFYQDTLIVAGGFWTIDGDTTLRVAKWIGGNYVDQCNNIGLEEEKENLEVETYPNPTKYKVTISIPVLNNKNTILYSVYNMIGEKIKTGIITENNTEIDLTNLPDGMYMLEIISGNKKAYKKLLKMN